MQAETMDQPTETFLTKGFMNLAKKILLVMASVGVLKKDKRNEFFNYQYASDELIVGAIRDALIKNSLVIFPSQKACSEIVVKMEKGGEQIVTKLQMDFELIDAESGESKIVTFYGYGADKSDKGVYKAATGAEKYFLMKQFLISTPDDPEFDRTQRDARAAYTPPSAPAKPATPATPGTVGEWNENEAVNIKTIAADIKDMIGVMCQGDAAKMDAKVREFTSWKDKEKKDADGQPILHSLDFESINRLAGNPAKHAWLRKIHSNVSNFMRVNKGK